ncbi:hypothetical protein DICVIV_02231 [Dictyocaulus viviparus]|uniref:SUEL-type lectin domain-containing protein n=1 Tax=Dictyocaulus viviparus TaxID=29172 RepID=A0A0D8Y3Y4_DICVI|nr:hypothetical protein DICVIV_02231 [Dictyocaulus viviparus]
MLLPKCHAKPSCSVLVTSETFGTPCPRGVPSYLSILFVCVNEEIFSEDTIKGDFESLEKFIKEIDEATTVGVTLNDKWERLTEKDIEFDSKPSKPRRIQNKPEPMFNNDAGYVTEDRYSLASAQDKNLEIQSDERAEQTIRMDENLIGITHDLMLVITFIKQNKDKALVCTILSVSLALILLMIACILHQFCGGDRRRKDKRVPYSIERSQLIPKKIQVILDGPPSLVEMGDFESETFLRYSLPTPPQSSHYDI